MREVSYEEAEKLRLRLHLTKKAFVSYLGVTRKKYWMWKKNGVAIETQRLLEVFIEEPEMIAGIFNRY